MIPQIVAGGRVPLSLSTSNLNQRITEQQAALVKLQDSLTSGQRFATPSDQPYAAIQTIALQGILERQDSYVERFPQLQGFLSTADQAVGSVADAVSRAHTIAQAAIGSTSSTAEKQSYAEEVGQLIKTVVSAGNTKYNGRNLFSGSVSNTLPFEQLANGIVRYNGDSFTLATQVDFNTNADVGVSGDEAFHSLTAVGGGNLNPGISLGTRLSSLRDGLGVSTGSIDFQLVQGVTTITQSVDLSQAETLQDVKTVIEAAFASSSITVAVDVDPTTQSGLRLTPSAGTIQVQDSTGSVLASQLGITSAATAVIHGSDLDPIITEFTLISSLNGGTGIGATAGTGLRIEHNGQVRTIDLNGATTIGDVLNRIRSADPDLIAKVSSDQHGLVVESRLAGATFSIGENGGQNATLLGLRTLSASTSLSTLNNGVGVPVNAGNPLKILRRDGTAVSVSLAGASTIQDVLDKINAVDPGHLVAGLASVGNGITLTDDSGAGELAIETNDLSTRLGLNKSENTGALGVLSGDDINSQMNSGVLGLLAQLQNALANGDDRTLTTLTDRLARETDRVNVIRGSIGSRQQFLESIGNRIADQHVNTRGTLSEVFDTNFTEVATQLLQLQQTLQATLQISANTSKLSLLQFL